MLHRVLPKSIDITTITQAMLDKAGDTSNNLPRKVLGYKAHNEVWAQFCIGFVQFRPRIFTYA
ncbi:IS30 family transposase domain protein [Candidatus Cyrtobacter comes]|uniref:IS30 family transposase domain protein n=1 Tax=Candidatus Cyrtobacter comes TaxID=675776 RepID=A0ABU5L739_9RICK|nr:IS30 family transposase domain protein [Candidatus Cyrtobacter comes]